MQKDKNSNLITNTHFPILKTVEQMSKISGIGENKLRKLMNAGKIEYIQNGNRRLLTEQAIIDWYHRSKIAVSDGIDRGEQSE